MNVMSNSKEIQGLRDDMSRIAKRLEKLTSQNSDELSSVVSQYADDASSTIKEYVRTASDTVKEQSEVAKKYATDAAKQTHRYAQENPWAVAGMAAGVALLIGLLSANRRDRD